MARIEIGGFSGVVWLDTAVSVCGPVRRGSRQLELVMEEARRPEEAWRSFILYCCGAPHQEDLHPEALTVAPVRQTLFHIKASFLLCVWSPAGAVWHFVVCVWCVALV